MPLPFWTRLHEFVVKYTLDYYTNPENQAWLGGPVLPWKRSMWVGAWGVYSQQAYRDLWARRLERGDDGTYYGNRINGDTATRLGVNCVVCALTQEGSLARQLVSR